MKFMRLKKYIAEDSRQEAIWLLKNKFSRYRYVKETGGVSVDKGGVTWGGAM
jgi:hypothetical protein